MINWVKWWSVKRINKLLAIVIVVELMGLGWFFYKGENIGKILNKEVLTEIAPIPTATVTPEVEVKPTLPSIAKEGFGNSKVKKVVTPTPDNGPWGVSKQIDSTTWTMKIGEDATMATSQEILAGLNEYRKVHGSQVLNWDEKLANYAKDRAKYLNGIKSVDQHKGFNDFMENQNGFNKLGFTSLGENISYGFRLNGVHIIEWMYAGDEPHNKNQLDNRWNYVGIGVEGLATSLIFGTGKF
jgi:uncharacterized protein YkwD